MPGSSKKSSPGMFSKKGTSPAAAPAAKPAMKSPSMPASVQPRAAPAAAPKAMPTSSTAPVHQPTGSHNAPTQQHAQAPMAPSSGGPGLLGQIAANAASTAGGVVMAHTIMNAFSGKKEEAVPAADNSANSMNTMSRNDTLNGPCANQYNTFLRCVENSNQNVSACQWALDMFNQCKYPNAPPQQNQTQF